MLSPDIRVPLWEKFVVVVPLSGPNALTRVPLGKYRDDPDLFALLEASLRETVAVGWRRASGSRQTLPTKVSR